MSRYEEADLSRVRRVPVRERRSKVDPSLLAHPPTEADSFAAFWDGLPGTLGAADLHALARAIVRARRRSRPLVWMFGAHVIKVGLGPLLVNLLREGFATLVAVNGAFAIHDAELALWGQTSEEVAEELHAGRFGMARETADFLNTAAREAADRGEGFGEALGRGLAERRSQCVTESVLATCYECGVPATVHVAIGTDIVHQHPEFSGEATGSATARDFRILARHLDVLSGTVVINVGSAVILPEVFLKALSVAINLGADADGLVTATLDFQKHYRPMLNVVRRPQAGRDQGYYILGHHEILLPLLYQGLLLEQGRT